MDNREKLDLIWIGDRLNRRHEANLVEAFITHEVDTFRLLRREQSIVLGIDAPYGHGKTWFLDRLSKQLSLSHPVARIDAWADDIGSEPLTAFMAAIDDAMAPYLKTSKKLRDKMAAAKAAALPVMGKIISGVVFKGLSKLTGDGLNEQLGEAIEEAVRGAKQKPLASKAGVKAAVMDEVFDKLEVEVDSIVDRQGAAMLAAYRKKKTSRDLFRQNMSLLVSSIDRDQKTTISPLIVMIDELDRCRPDYAIRVLEEVKHFFEVPGVVFILGMHGNQLSKSVNAVYGAEFDSSDYLRRFFTRRYELRRPSTVELSASIFDDWKIDRDKIGLPELALREGYPVTPGRTIGLILSEWSISPREIYSAMDALRLFVRSWEYKEKIEPIALLSLIVRLVRGQELNFLQDRQEGVIRVKGLARVSDYSDSQALFQMNDYLKALSDLAWAPLTSLRDELLAANPARNYALSTLQAELRSRSEADRLSLSAQSYITNYISRVIDLAGLFEQP